MEQDIRLHEQFYILASEARADGGTHVLKHADTFAIFDHLGDIGASPSSEQGLYHAGTRYLSRLELLLNRQRPLTLSSSVREDNDVFMVDLTNPEIYHDGRLLYRRDVLHIVREKCLWEAACYERLRLTHYGVGVMTLSLTLRFDADFADIFEVRGHRRPRRGRRLEPRSEAGALVLAYEGLDGVTRRTTIECSPAPDLVTENEMELTIALPAQKSASIHCTVRCDARGSASLPHAYEETLEAVRAALLSARERRSRVETSNQQFNQWIRRASADLDMLLTRSAHGVYPYAGVPWYSTPFSRDGIITALELLWLDPTIARGVLTYLADTQATERDPQRDAEPGKILHEARRGEMAALGEVPFGRYYGSVDATPLFLLLAGAYYERTADLAFIETLWPNVAAAMQWIDTEGDPDGDGLVEYIRRSPDGLVQQGWKDSPESMFTADGTLAEPPIALCEVQAYVYRAKRDATDLLAALGRRDEAARLAAQADRLQARFEALFWSEELSMYAMALDGRKRQCRVRSSNAGHCLFGRIASPEHARRVARAIMAEDMFSGWGVRTIGAGEARYNPMSYHNGSVWPHDNAIIASGLSQYGFTETATAILQAIFDLGSFEVGYRTPELVCGFERRPDQGPTAYPVACAPQAWSAGALFMLLQSALGISIRAAQRQIRLERSRLPASLEWLEIVGLRVGEASVDLRFERDGRDVGIQVLRQAGDVEIIAVA